jgi:hypothetical protein
MAVNEASSAGMSAFQARDDVKVRDGSVDAHDVEHLPNPIVCTVKNDATSPQGLDRPDDRTTPLESVNVRSVMSIVIGPPGETSSAIATFMIGAVATSSSPLRRNMLGP